MSGCDICEDNRFELIAKYRAKLVDSTNIEDRPEEMAVIDNVLFRFWQIGWLDQLEKRDNEFARLKVENHKLRKLLQDMLIQTDQYCDKYCIEYKDIADAFDKANTDVDRRLHELGIMD